MKKTTMKIASFLVAIVALASFAGNAFAQTYIHANGGTYWSQSGTGWNSINNDGYCVSGRGPCGSNLWYLQWSNNHYGCGYDNYAMYTMASVVGYNGSTYAWIDSSTGSMYGADYDVAYNYGSEYAATVNQSAYYEAWVTIATGKYRTADVVESNAWGAAYACNGVSGKQVEYDEVKLEI